MHHYTDRIAHTTAFVTPVVEHVNYPYNEKNLNQILKTFRGKSKNYNTEDIRTFMVIIYSQSELRMLLRDS